MSTLQEAKMTVAAKLINDMLAGLADWRGKTLADIRKVILEADPEITEEWKWKGAPVWSHSGIVCVANAFKDKIKLTFYHGSDLPDPAKLFNNGLNGKQWRTIDFFKNDKIKERELKNLVLAAVAFNLAKASPKAGVKK
jgi:hypothetical protein